ncbi:epimerase [Mesorhizobium sp. SARCC-RB16n]|uniref:SDR family oxidoreductase n=1 Tax=Mesorhizobium sp. SARCC-RB16n TaxID=2116687 RepID=UPI00122F90DE|nr:SDR family oxidoreductase [Mesorhizobium sp. SARCC-RB16n]KAA3447809.1 epimerase [Mesorhizobium sp. SARCC-RB16n]
MRVFVTGATGFIGSAVVQELIGAGHQVVGLARSDAAAKSLAAAGAQAHHGSIDDVASLRAGAAAADGVIHLAYMHGLSKMTIGGRLRILFGGLPGGIISRFLAVSSEADRRAIDALGSALEGSGRPLVVTFGTMGLVPSGAMTEEDAPDPRSPGASRAASEKAVQVWASRGVRASIVRLPPSVHGDGDTGLIAQLIGIARKKRVSAYLGDGSNRWPAVHRLDAAYLFRLALEKGTAGARYHGVADEGVAFRAIADVIGSRLGVPVAAKTAREGAGQFSWLAPFVAADNPASSQRTRERLGWQPGKPGLIADINRPGYFGA